MTQLQQIQCMFDLRKVKVDGLRLAVAAAQSERSRAHDEVEAADAALQVASAANNKDFDALFAAADESDDPHTRLQTVQRTLLQNRRAQEAARRRSISARAALEEAMSALRDRVQDLNVALAQLDAVEDRMKDAAQVADALAQDQADDLALETLAARGGRGRS